MILHHMERAVRMSRNICSAIKFDIDLIVAINDYSYATGHAIVDLVHRTLRKHQNGLRVQDVAVLSIELPESDEVIWILPNQTVEKAADIADSIRRDIKRELVGLPYYAEACAFVCEKLRSAAAYQRRKGRNRNAERRCRSLLARIRGAPRRDLICDQGGEVPR